MSTCEMRIQYDETIDEVVDDHQRLLKRSRVARGWRWNGAIATGLLAGILCFAVTPKSTSVRLVYGAIGAVVGSSIYPFLHRRATRRCLRRLLREQLGDDGPSNCETVLIARGIRCKTRSTELNWGWDAVESISELPDPFEFWIRNGGLVVVRKRGFNGEEQIRQFRELADQLWQQGRVSNEPASSSQISAPHSR